MDEPAAAGRSVTQRGADQVGVTPDHLGRQQPPVDQRAGSVHVGGDLLEQLDPLGHAGRDRPTRSSGSSDQGERVEQARGAGRGRSGAQAVPAPGSIGAPELVLAERGEAGRDRLGPSSASHAER